MPHYRLHLLSDHPLKDMFKSGIPVTLPCAVSGIYLGANTPALCFRVLRDETDYPFDYIGVSETNHWVETIHTQPYNRFSRWFYWQLKRLGL